jgi:hypothetical protein
VVGKYPGKEVDVGVGVGVRGEVDEGEGCRGEEEDELGVEVCVGRRRSGLKLKSSGGNIMGLEKSGIRVLGEIVFPSLCVRRKVSVERHGWY